MKNCDLLEEIEISWWVLSLNSSVSFYAKPQGATEKYKATLSATHKLP